MLFLLAGERDPEKEEVFKKMEVQRPRGVCSHSLVPAPGSALLCGNRRPNSRGFLDTPNALHRSRNGTAVVHYIATFSPASR